MGQQTPILPKSQNRATFPTVIWRESWAGDVKLSSLFAHHCKLNTVNLVLVMSMNFIQNCSLKSNLLT